MTDETDPDPQAGMTEEQRARRFVAREEDLVIATPPEPVVAPVVTSKDPRDLVIDDSDDGADLYGSG